MILAGLAFGAYASTVAVLPLARGAASDQYDGLGTALAGMITSDLSGVPGVTLVERQRLDAVLDELTLGESRFVDPQTAQQYGHGLGAEYVVVGSYSVVGGRFLLDGRIVEVASGTIAAASTADGTVEDFVAVEKKLVAAMAGGLGAKAAAPPVDAPTHDFDAFAAYGEGLAAERRGEDAAARDHFADAVAKDPKFAQASTALGSLRAAEDQRWKEKADREKSARDAVLEATVAAFPDPRTPGFPAKDTAESIGGFAIRLMALEEQGRDCDRYAEMTAYLDRVGWKVAYPKGGWEKTWQAAYVAGVKTGFLPDPKSDNWAAEDGRFAVQTGPIEDWQDTAHFLFQFPDPDPGVDKADDLLTAMSKCLAPAEQEAELERIRGKVDAAGQGGLVYDADYPDVTLDERLELRSLDAHARQHGVDATTNQRIEALIAAHAGREQSKTWMMRRADSLAQLGETYERQRVSRLGMTDPVLVGVMRAVANADATRLHVDQPVCKALVDQWQAYAKATVDAKKPRPPAESAVPAAIFRDLGCLDGVPARFADPAAAFAWIGDAKKRERPEYAKSCEEYWDDVEQTSKPSALEQATTLPEPTRSMVVASTTSTALATYYGRLVLPLCVDEGW